MPFRCHIQNNRICGFTHNFAKFFKITCKEIILSNITGFSLQIRQKVNSFTGTSLEKHGLGGFSYYFMFQQQLHNAVINFKRNVVNLTAGSFDHLIRYLQITVTAKAKPDPNPSEQIPDGMKEKKIKDKKRKSYY